MSNTTKFLIIAAAVIIALIVIICLIIRKIKKKVKKTIETVDRCGEYAARILRIADKVKNGEAKELLTGVAEDFKLSDIKEVLSSDNKLDAVLDMLEDEADAEETDIVKISDAVAGIRGLLAEAKGKAEETEK